MKRKTTFSSLVLLGAIAASTISFVNYENLSQNELDIQTLNNEAYNIDYDENEYNFRYESRVDNPVDAGSFYALEGTVTHESFKFWIDAKPEGISDGTFDPTKSFLSYSEDKTTYFDLNTEYINAKEEKLDSEYVRYEFKVTNLDPGASYGNLRFTYNEAGAFVDISEEIVVTTKPFISPFDPIEKPVEFDYESVTSNSFEFEIDVVNESIEDAPTSRIDRETITYAGFAPEETVIFANNRQLNTTLISSPKEDVQTRVGYETYRYQVTGLDASTTYSDFAIVINTYGGNTAINMPGADKLEFYTTIFEIPYVSIRTMQDEALIKLRTTISIFMVLLIILVIVLYILYWIWNRKVSLAIFADVSSIELNIPIFSIINGRKHRKFWNANTDEMKFYVAGEEIAATFYKELDVRGEETGVVKVAISNAFDNGKNMFFIMAGAKHNEFEVSYDGGQVAYAINSIHNKKLEKLIKEHEKGLSEGKTAQAVFMFNKFLATPTTLRYEAIIPEGHELEKVTELSMKSGLTFYHQLDDKMYPLKVEYIGKVGVTHSWDIVGLTPGTVYVNIHWSINGKDLLPSTINYGQTKDADGNEISLQESELSKKPTTQGKPLPSLKANVEYMGRKPIMRQNTVAAQKHFQRDTGFWFEGKLLTERIKQYLYRWYEDIDVLFYDLDEDEILNDKKAREIKGIIDAGENNFEGHLYKLIVDQVGANKVAAADDSKKSTTPKKKPNSTAGKNAAPAKKETTTKKTSPKKKTDDKDGGK